MGNKRTPNNITATVLYLRPRLYRGVYTRVAKQLGVNRATVRAVGTGNKTSRRIMAALVEESARIEREITRFISKRKAA